MGSEGRRRIRDLTYVYKGPRFRGESPFAEQGFIEVKVGDEIVASQRTASLAALACGDVAAHLQRVVSQHAQDKQLVDGLISKSLSDEDPLLNLVIVSLRSREPMEAGHSLRLQKSLAGSRPKPSHLGRDGGGKIHPPLREAPCIDIKLGNFLELEASG